MSVLPLEQFNLTLMKFQKTEVDHHGFSSESEFPLEGLDYMVLDRDCEQRERIYKVIRRLAKQMLPLASGGEQVPGRPEGDEDDESGFDGTGLS